MSTATSVQDMVRPGEVMDIYYYDADTSKKQAFPTTQNTKYVQQFANLTGGSSVFTIPPNNGLQDIVLTLVMPNLAGAATGLALPRGWGYALIKQVSYRYGGSSQFFLTGDQILQNALRRQPSTTAMDDILTLGGNVSVAADLSGNSQTAYVVLTLPHNIPSMVNKTNPLPTDLLTQQVQVTVELNPIASVFTIAAAGAATPPSGLSSAQFQVQQVLLNNQSDALARRVDMAENAYAFPCEFVQQIQRIPLANGGNPFLSGSAVLTGFRSGEVKAVHCWLTRSGDIRTGSTGANNPLSWYPIASIQMTYAGDVYARYENGSSFLWNLVNGNKVPRVDQNFQTVNGATITNTPSTSYWVELPFAQTFEGEGDMNTLVHGKPITNGIVNLDITAPFSASDWVLNVSYIYNATLLFSQGTCDYVF
jgi:hypothetical protein